MTNIKDLSLINQEPLVLKFSEDEQFTIPSDPKLTFIYQLMEYEEKMKKAKSGKAQFDLLIDMATKILAQDSSKNIDSDFVKNKLHQSQIRSIVQIYQQQMMENNNNPN